MNIEQEPKYKIEKGKIVNRADGIAIPDNEPVFIFRAKDIKAAYAIECYSLMLNEGVHKQVVLERFEDFKRYQQENKNLCGIPDSDESCLKAN